MAQAPQDHTEVEWQFETVDVRPVLRWLERNVPGDYRVTATGTKELRDTYFDTDDWRIYRAGFTCRVREKGDAAELTLKSMAEAKNGIRTRRELTERVGEATAEAIAAAPGPCGELIRAVAGRRELQPLFTLVQARRAFRLDDTGGEVAEIAVDETRIPVGVEDEPAKISRIEVELTNGSLDRARGFVDALVAGCGLEPARVSKFRAGLQASGKQPPGPPDLGPSEVHAGMTAGEVGYAVLRRHFAALVANEPGTRLGEDPEALHDMRVAARRLRAALQVFRPFLPPELQRFREEIAWIARALGEVRDLDVQLERMPGWRTGFGPGHEHALDNLETLLRQHRRVARRHMLSALDSERYETLLEGLESALRADIRTFAPGNVPILAVAPGIIERRYRRLRKRGDAIRRDSPATDYHLLRIEAKKLRYALEFVRPIYGKPARRFVARLTELQDLLGLHQDAEVAQETLYLTGNEAGQRLGPETLMAMGAIAERYRRQAQKLRRAFPGVYRPLTGRDWTRLRRVLEARRMLAPVTAGDAPPLARMAPQHKL